MHEVFGKLGSRERWPIPWIEDDPAMWLTQLHVHRFERDLNRAAQFGCQGLLGIHWRHRIVDPTAGFQARFSWDDKLKPAAYYRSYAATQAAGDRAAPLAEVLTDADRNRKLLSTWTGKLKQGHAETQEYSGDYSEGFTFWNKYEPDPAVVESQKQVAAALRRIAGNAGSPLEAERVEYLTRHIEFMVPYTEAWTLAHRLHEVLEKAAKLKSKRKVEEARALVRSEGVPLWLKMAPEVRAAMLHFQRIVATRNDLGTLASKHNKLVRLAFHRLRLSMKEYLGELPEEVGKLLAEAFRPDADAPARLFAPTRPTMLSKGESVRVMVIAAGEAPVGRVLLHTRARGAAQWTTSPARLMGRRTYEVQLGPFDPAAVLAEYYFTAEAGTAKLAAPPDAPGGTYVLTLG
jgi:hypothetical protein